MYWEWLSSCELSSIVDGSSAGEVDARVAIGEGVSFQDVLLAAYDTLCKVLPDCDGLAYKKVCFCASSAGLSMEEADAFAAWYFALNHGMSPLEVDLEKDKEFVPLDSLLDDVTMWFRTHQYPHASESLREYASSALTDRPEHAKSLTQLIATDKVIFPTSRVFWSQSMIASYGVNGYPVDVGGGAIVKASIRGSGGKDIDITPDQLHLQAVIGQMIMENGAPITVTPAQLYKAFAGLPTDAYVHEAQEASMVAAMDAMLFTEATLDISMQLEKHKRMERKPDVDYDEFLNRRANLVVGVKDTSKSVTYNGTRLKTTYTIYQAPLYFQYSYAINQLATVDRSILSGGAATRNLPKGHPDKKPLQRRVRNVVLRRYLMQQVERIKQDKAKKKKTGAHTENLTFDTIAAACGIDLTHNLRQQLRADVKLVLTDFKCLKYILDATEYKAGRAIKGMRITV